MLQRPTFFLENASKDIDLYRDVLKSLPAETLQKLIELKREEMELFGYDFNLYNLNNAKLVIFKAFNEHLPRLFVVKIFTGCQSYMILVVHLVS